MRHSASRIAVCVLAFAAAALAADPPSKMLKVPPASDRPMPGKGTPVSAAPSPSPTAKASPEATPQKTEAPAESPESGEEAIVPSPFPLSRYAVLWENSPFQNESIAPPQQSEGLAQRFVLGGILRQGGEPVVWVRERATQQSYKLARNQTNNLGLSLVDVREVMTNQLAATATIRLGNEQGEIKFDSQGAGAPAGIIAPPQMVRPPVPTPMRAPQAGNSAPAPGQPANPQGQAIPGAQTLQPGVAGQTAVQPGVVAAVPGASVPAGQVQAPGQVQMPPPRVIRRRAIVPAAPSTP